MCEGARKERPRRAEYIALPKRIEDASQSQEWHDAKARCMETVRRLTGDINNPFGKPSNAWAYKILARRDAGEIMPIDSLRMANNAIRMETEGFK